MEYNTKWVKENLGITIDMIKNYEKEEIIHIDRDPISNNRVYTEKDIEKLWTIKFLIKIGFKISAIKKWQENSSIFDLERVISEKYEDLKQEVNFNKKILFLLKYIKTSGRIPNVKEKGSVTFDEFIKIVFDSISEEDILFDEQMESFKKININNLDKFSEKDLDNISAFFNENSTILICGSIVNTYYKVISELKDLGTESEIIRKIVKSFYLDIEKYKYVFGFNEKYNIDIFKKYFNPSYYEGDMKKNYEDEYGKESVLFISKVLENFEIDGY